MGNLLLLAAASETGIMDILTGALPSDPPAPSPRLSRSTPATRHRLVRTLLFLGAVGLHRLWDLRGYSGDGLALLTGRRRAYGYAHTERFLAQVTRAGGAESLTDALAAWTATLWPPPPPGPGAAPPSFYVDGHHKAVYADRLLPRGLVARRGVVLGCRALVLLHDAQGHPLLVTTHRGDLHLTTGLPQIVARFEHAARPAAVARIIVDREGMAAAFLAGLAAAGRTVVTVLRADQYAGLASFTDVGPFVPLQYDRHGRMVREVAPARFTLPLPDRPDARLDVSVALVRDLRRQVPSPGPDPDHPRRWDADLDGPAAAWWDAGWVATPAHGALTAPKLIPIITTAPAADPVELARTYFRRWPAQENVIKDFLLPLGLDTNHGYAKAPVVNSEVAKRRVALERRLVIARRWADGARARAQRAQRRSDRLWPRAKACGEARYRALNQELWALEAQG